ncbi:MAG: acyl-CoA hydrolase [Akkermansiaceae bacterium]|jgi:acyl-CoA hydrolase
METHRLVLPEDLNQYGSLFGGRLLAWVDEASWIAASLDFPDCRFFTIAMDQVVFRHGVKEGTILIIQSQKSKLGNTSVTYEVQVFRGRDSGEGPIFTTCVTFVNLDESGAKIPLPS